MSETNGHIIDTQTEGELIKMEGDIAGSVRLLTDPKLTSNTNMASMIQTLHPGAAIPNHFHKQAEQILYFIKGEGQASLMGESTTVSAGTLLHIPKGAEHSVSNTGKNDLSFLEITTPPGFEGAFRQINTYENPEPEEIAKACSDNDIHFA